MAYEAVHAISLEVIAASADIPQRRFVTFETTNGLQLPADVGQGVNLIGVTLEGYDDSEADAGNGTTVIPVAMLNGSGKLEAEAGAAIAVGDLLIVGNDGRPIPSTTTAGGTVPAGNYREIGIAVSATGAAAEVVTFVPITGPVVTTA
jgi:hypothetical protein